MDTNYHEDFMIVQDIDRYVVIDEDTYRWILANINCNYLLILFTMSCVASLICSHRKRKDDYVLIQEAKPVKGAIVEEGINRV